MSSYQSPLLTQRVPYDWDELKRVAQELKSVKTVDQSDEGLVRLMPVSQHSSAESEQSESFDSPQKSQLEAVVPTAGLSEDELVAKIVPKVIERLNSQIEIIVDVTLKTAATRIRTDLQKAVENTVRLTVREELKKSRQ